MSKGSIQQKIGKCVACPPEAKEMPLITDKCSSHYWAHRASLKEKKPPKRVPVKKISDKQTTKNKVYTAKRIIFLAAHPKCQAKLEGCTQVATDVHHMAGRTGSLFLDESQWLPVCRACHSYIETHPDFAKEKGFSKSRLTKE